MISFTADEASNLTVVSLGMPEDADWNFVLLNGATSFTLPDLADDPLPSGELQMYVGAFVVDGFDPQEIGFEDGLIPVAVRFADATGRVSR